MAKPPSLADILDMPADQIPKAYRGLTVCANAKAAKQEVSRMQAHFQAPKTHQDACALCQPKEIEWLNLVLAGAEHAAAASQVFSLDGRSAVNKGALLFSRTPRVMIALELGRREIAGQVKYTIERVIEDIDKAIDFAKDNNNPAAYTRSIEMKAKLTGHLGKDDARPEGSFHLHIHAG